MHQTAIVGTAHTLNIRPASPLQTRGVKGTRPSSCRLNDRIREKDVLLRNNARLRFWVADECGRRGDSPPFWSEDGETGASSETTTPPFRTRLHGPDGPPGGWDGPVSVHACLGRRWVVKVELERL